MPLLLLRLLPALLVLTLPISPPVHADTLNGKVVRILDGDTVEVVGAHQRRHRVRLAGIDAPESEQPFGTKVKRALSSPVGGETVTVVWHQRDRYDRLVGRLMLDSAGLSAARALACLGGPIRARPR